MLKNTFATALAVVSTLGASAQMRGIQRQPLGGGHSLLRTDSGAGKFLLLPIQDSAPEARLRFVEGNREVNTFNVRLAQSHVDYVLPIDLSQVGAYTAIYTLGVPDSALFWSGLALSEEANIPDEPYRPLFHFSPRQGWMNDPNGLFYADGVYHYYYQYNPFGSTWGNMHWGHATSRDLLAWEHHPLAIAPDVHGAIFSGSCVVDKDNTAGFGQGAVIAFYTSAGDGQTQSIAYSTDGGYTFTKYEGNPVLTSPRADFRDPKVIWHEPTKSWVMLLAVGQEMQFFTSKNLKDWTYTSSFGEGYGAHGGVWECPDLMEISVEGTNEKEWVLFCNINPGGPSGGSATQYFVGSFDGRTFTTKTDGDKVKWMDYGKDHYATVSWFDAPGASPTVIAWMSNWEYATVVPTKYFRSATSLPRTLGLYRAEDGESYLSVYPIEGARALHAGKAQRYGSTSLSQRPRLYSIAKPDAYELLVAVQKGQAEDITLRLGNDKGEELLLVLDFKKSELRIDRSKSGIVDFAEKFSTPIPSPLPQADSYELRIFVDKASIEIFDNKGGRYTQTNIFFPTEPLGKLSLSARGRGAKLRQLSIYPLALDDSNQNKKK